MLIVWWYINSAQPVAVYIGAIRILKITIGTIHYGKLIWQKIPPSSYPFDIIVVIMFFWKEHRLSLKKKKRNNSGVFNFISSEIYVNTTKISHNRYNTGVISDNPGHYWSLYFAQPHSHGSGLPDEMMMMMRSWVYRPMSEWRVGVVCDLWIWLSSGTGWGVKVQDGAMIRYKVG